MAPLLPKRTRIKGEVVDSRPNGCIVTNQSWLKKNEDSRSIFELTVVH